MTIGKLGFGRVAVIGDGPVADGVAKLLAGNGIEIATVGPFLRGGSVDAVQSFPSLPDAADFLSEADWIVEASGMPLADKQAMFRYIEVVRKKDCLVSSDESVLTRAMLIEGLGKRFDDCFAVMHFFIPVDRLPLVELVTGESMPAANQQRFADLCHALPGRTVLHCADKPGFIANRIGLFWIAMAATKATHYGIGICDADAISHAGFGLPRSGVFGLADLIGPGLVRDLTRSLQQALPKGDPLHQYSLDVHPLFLSVARIADTGFYQKLSPSTAREVLADDGGSYRVVQETDARFSGMTLDQLLLRSDIFGAYTLDLLEQLDAYAERVCAEHGISIAQVGQAMQLGYGWRKSPIGRLQTHIVGAQRL